MKKGNGDIIFHFDLVVLFKFKGEFLLMLK